MQSLRKRLLQYREQLSKLEQQVLDYIIRYPEKMVSLTLIEAANKMYVSTATISRTCKKIGFQGYQDFKLQLQLYLQHHSQMSETNEVHVLSQTVKRYEQDMASALQRVDHSKLNQAANMLRQAAHIEWFGVGHSYPVCWDGSKKLQLFNKKSVAHSDWDNLRSAANNLTKDDVAIFVSFSGETLSMVEFVHLVKERGTPIISFVGTQENQVAKMSDLIFYSPIHNYYINDVDFTFRGTLQMLVDLMLMEYFKIQSHM